MLNRPRFRPHFHVEVVPGEGVFLLSGARQTLLRGRLYELVAPWLDGRPADDLCDRLRG
jgi:ribosomal protein S12 methylthiotransferase accessory factor